jgi:hypothetical protein
MIPVNKNAIGWLTKSGKNGVGKFTCHNDVK